MSALPGAKSWFLALTLMALDPDRQSEGHRNCCCHSPWDRGESLSSSFGQTRAKGRALNLESTCWHPQVGVQSRNSPQDLESPAAVKGSRKLPLEGDLNSGVTSKVRSGVLIPGKSRAAASAFFSLRCHGAGAVAPTSQQLPRRSVPSPWNPSWNSPSSPCPPDWGSETIPTSAYSDQVQWGDGAEHNGGGGSAQVKPGLESFPLPAPRKLREEELRATSLPSIPNPFPELCSPPSQAPILGGSSGTRGLLPRDASHHVSHPEGEILQQGWEQGRDVILLLRVFEEGRSRSLSLIHH